VAEKKKKSKPRDPRKMARRKPCWFCEQGYLLVDYKDDQLLRKFMTERGKISPRRNTGTCAKHQRLLAAAVKRARHIALVPFVREYYR
jgi:small subunit ribosomal protein S18